MKEKQKIIVGSDVSKYKLDFSCPFSGEDFIIENDPAHLSKLGKWMEQHEFKTSDIWLVFEYTGKYTHHLRVYCEQHGITYSEVPALEIKRSMGIVRGKNDKIDARRIAAYAEEKRYKLLACAPANAEIESLKRYMSLRDRLVRQRAGYKTSVKELKDALHLKETDIEVALLTDLIKSLTVKIDALEKEIDNAIKTNPDLKQNYNLLQSIKGIGPVIALYTLIYTGNFTKFSNSRKFASYCGIAPFEDSSGTIKKKTKISHLANKKIKSLLDQGARSAILYNAEIRQYHARKIKEGKTERCVINVVRNKLVARMFAVINKQRPYEIKIAA